MRQTVIPSRWYITPGVIPEAIIEGAREGDEVHYHSYSPDWVACNDQCFVKGKVEKTDDSSQ